MAQPLYEIEGVYKFDPSKYELGRGAPVQQAAPAREESVSPIVNQAIESPAQYTTKWKAFSESFKEEFRGSYDWLRSEGKYNILKAYSEDKLLKSFGFPEPKYLSGEEYENSGYKVDGKSYPQGIPLDVARIRFEKHQREKYLQEVISKLNWEDEPYLSKVAVLGGQFAGSMSDPVFLAAASVFPSGGIAAKIGQLLNITKPIAKGLLSGTIHGSAAGLIGGSLEYGKQEAYDEEHHLSDIAKNVVFGAAFGTTLSIGKAVIGKMISADSHKTLAVKAISQAEQAKQVNIEPYYKALTKDMLPSREEIIAAEKGLLKDFVFEQAASVQQAVPEAGFIKNSEKLSKLIAEKKLGTVGFEDTFEKITSAKEPDKALLAEVTKLHDEYLTDTIQKRVLQYAKGKPEKTAEGLQAFLAGTTTRANPLSRDSVALYQGVKELDAYTVFAHELEKRGVRDLYAARDPIIEKEITMTLHGETVSLQNQEARQIAEAVKVMWDRSVAQFKRLGVKIPDDDIKDYIARMFHNAEKASATHETAYGRLKFRVEHPLIKTEELEETAYQRWKDTQLALLDQRATFKNMSSEKPEKIESSLRNMYNNMVSKRRKYQEAQYGIAERWTRKRFFIYKDAHAWLEANRIYGCGTLYDAVNETISRTSKTIALAEKMGLSPRSVFNNLVEKLSKQKGMTPSAIKSLYKQEKIFNELIGASPYHIESSLLKTVTTGLLKWEYATKAAKVTLTSINDLAHSISVQQKMLGKSPLGAMLHTYINQPKEFIKALGEAVGIKVSKRDLDLIAGWAEHAMVGSRYTDVNSSKFLQITNKLNLIHYWDKGLVNRTAIDTARTLYQYSRLSFGQLKEDLRKTFALYGIDEKTWDLIRSHRFRASNGRHYITVDSTFDYSKEATAKYLNKSVEAVTDKQTEAVREEVRHKLLMFNKDLVDYVRIVPDVVENARYLKGSHLAEGFLGRTFMQFKGFPIAMARRILSLVMENSVEGFKNDGFIGLVRGPPKDIPAALTYIANGLLLGYLSDSAKKLVKGQMPQDPEDPNTWLKILPMFAGIYGDTISNLTYAGLKKQPVDVVASLAAPAWSDIKKAGNVALKGVFQGKIPQKDFFDLIKGNIPYINLPYTQLAADMLLMWELQRKIAPNSYYRMKFGNDYWADD